MKQLFSGLLFFALAGSLVAAQRPQDRDDHHDNGKHNGQVKQEDRGNDHHDNGRHVGQVKHEQDRDHHQEVVQRTVVRRDVEVHHDYSHEHFRPGRLYPYGHYEHVRSEFVVHRFDVHTRRIFLADNSNWIVASYDAPRCRDWDWDRDRVFVYADDHDPGWYLLFNARLGAYVHVEFAGIH